MFKALRGALIGLVAFVSLFSLASAASAITVSPSGAYNANSVGNTLLTFTSNRRVLTCTASRISATVDSTGAGTSTAGSTVYSGCSNGLLGAFTVTQTSNWDVESY